MPTLADPSSPLQQLPVNVTPVARRGHPVTALLTAATWTTITLSGSESARSKGAETEPSPIAVWRAVPDEYNTLARFDTSFSPSSSALDNDEQDKLASSSPEVSFVRAVAFGGDDEVDELLSSEPDNESVFTNKPKCEVDGGKEEVDGGEEEFHGVE